MILNFCLFVLQDLQPNENITSWSTFGVTGQTGTVGSKTMHYNADSPLDFVKK
jgi:hypothetical protein